MFVSKFYRGKSYLRESAGGDILVLSSFLGPFGGPVLCCVEADDGVKPVFRFVFAFLHGVGERIEQRFRFFLMEDVCYTLSIKLLKSK
jgi:hypothetical protein